MNGTGIILGFFWSTFSILDWIEIVAAVLVAIGCIGELYLVFKNPPKDDEVLKRFEKKKHLLERVFVCVVALGVTTELVALPFALKESAKLQAEVERLKSENLKLMLLALPRDARLDNAVELGIPLLVRFRGTAVVIETRGDDQDAGKLSSALARLLVLSGFNISGRFSSVGLRENRTGIAIVSNPSNMPAAKALEDLLNKCLLDAKVFDGTENNLHITVGSRIR